MQALFKSSYNLVLMQAILDRKRVPLLHVFGGVLFVFSVRTASVISRSRPALGRHDRGVLLGLQYIMSPSLYSRLQP